jgi:hypothetical protein
MKSMAKVYMALALVAVICLPGMASADTVWLAYMGTVPAGVTNITETLSPPYSGGVYTGNYTIAYQTAPSAIINGYCVDVQDSSPVGTFEPFKVVPITPGSAYAAAAWVLSQGYSGMATEEGQVAVWELVWDYRHGNAFSLTAGNFKLNDPNPTTSQFATDVGTIYTNALNAVNGGWNPSGYVIVQNDTYQDFVVPNPVPIPPTALLMVTGLLGLVGLGWRR